MNILIAFLLLITSLCEAAQTSKIYPLTTDPIDVVLVTHPKDKVTLDLCIEGVKTYGENIGRVIVVSSEYLTDKAEWFDEANYPFSKADVALQIGREDPEVAEKFFARGGHPVGWYYQQLLKMYALYVIPDISPNVLVIDSDSVFTNPVQFMDERGGGFLCYSNRRATKSHYQAHAERMVPSYRPIHPNLNSVNHHMLFQKPIMDDLFDEVESYHGLPFWQVFCQAVDIKRKWGSGSEYEIYYNFALTHTRQVSLRHLRRRASSVISSLDKYREEGLELVSFHSYMRK